MPQPTATIESSEIKPDDRDEDSGPDRPGRVCVLLTSNAERARQAAGSPFNIGRRTTPSRFPTETARSAGLVGAGNRDIEVSTAPNTRRSDSDALDDHC